MGRGKQTAVYLFLAVALALLFLLAFPGFWRDCAASLSTGRQEITYTRASAGSSGTVYAVGRKDETWVLAQGTLSGGREKLRSLDSLGMSGVVTVSQLYACSGGGVVLSVYEQRADLACRAYYLAPGAKEARMIYSATCETREDLEMDGMTENGGVVTFLLRQGEGAAAFRYAIGEATAEQIHAVAAAEAGAALFVLPDGGTAVASEGSFALGGSTLALPEGMRPVEGWRLADGACVLDGVDGAVWRLDAGTGKRTRLTALGEIPDADIVSASVSPDGGVLLLTDEGRLLYLWDEAFQDCTGALYRPRWQSGALMALAIAGVLLVALGLWYFLCEYRKLQISLVARQGAAAALLLVLAAGAAVRWAAAPYFEDWAAWEAERYLRKDASDTLLGLDRQQTYSLLTGTVMRWAMAPYLGDWPTWVETPDFEDWAVGEADRALRRAATDGVPLPDTQKTYFTREDGALYRMDSGEGTITSALGLGSAWRQAAERAMEDGDAFLEYSRGGVDYYGYFIRNGTNQLMLVESESAPYREESNRGLQRMSLILWGTAGLILAAVLLVLVLLRRRLQRITEGLDALHAGQEHVRVVDWVGDEVGAMADSLNALAVTMRLTGEEELRRGDLYARFLPARIAQLLGEETVEQINKQSFASLRMVSMRVSFSFEARMYENRSKALFDNINEITESTAKIITAQGGTILSFSHEGFDAFFPAGDGAPISAAVAICQEAAVINRSRERRNISPVSLHIALDEGEVMLGVVGDENRMQVTAVSPSFSTTRMLTSLFSKFDASILCTEAVEALAGGYGRRYIGKAHDGAELVRVYELYDGDAQSVRQAKEETGRAFSDGVYTLYAGDYTAAKRTFMEISRKNSEDGAAKFYLYLADRFEKEPPEEVSLDG